MMGSLRQSDPCNVSLTRSPQYVFYHPTADGDVLPIRINSDGGDTGDCGVLPQEVATDHSPVDFGNDRVDVAA